MDYQIVYDIARDFSFYIMTVVLAISCIFFTLFLKKLKSQRWEFKGYHTLVLFGSFSIYLILIIFFLYSVIGIPFKVISQRKHIQNIKEGKYLTIEGVVENYNLFTKYNKSFVCFSIDSINFKYTNLDSDYSIYSTLVKNHKPLTAAKCVRAYYFDNLGTQVITRIEISEKGCP